jgi:hypothetical protein
MNTSKTRIVIRGGGLAGVQCARTLRVLRGQATNPRLFSITPGLPAIFELAPSNRWEQMEPGIGLRISWGNAQARAPAGRRSGVPMSGHP